MSADIEPGLRERKRAATRLLIERAALTLALERGFENVTIDQISEFADISARTFFNYFPSKEAAVLSHSPDLPDDEQVEAFVSAGPDESILDGIRRMLSAAIEDKDVEMAEVHELVQLRRELMLRSPELFAARMAGMQKIEEVMVAIVVRRLERDMPAVAESDPEGVRARALLLVYVAFAGIRHAWTCWAAQGGSGDLASSVQSSFDQLHELVGATA